MATKTCELCKRPISPGHTSCPYCVTTRMVPGEMEGIEAVEVEDDAIEAEVVEEGGQHGGLSETAEFIAEEVVDDPETVSGHGPRTDSPSLKRTQPAFPGIVPESLGEIDLGRHRPDPNSPPTDLKLVSAAMEPPRPGQMDDDDEGIAAEVVDEDDEVLDVAEEVESGSAVNLAEPDVGRRDLIAEQVESDADLTGVGSHAHPAADEDDSAIDLGGSYERPTPAAAAESSAVDLGSSELIEIPEDVIDEVEGKAAPRDKTHEGPLKLRSLEHEEQPDIEDFGEVGRTFRNIDPHQTVDLPRTGIPTQAVIGGSTEMMGDEDLIADMLQGSGPAGALDEETDGGTVDEGSDDEVFAEDEPLAPPARRPAARAEEEELEPESAPAEEEGDEEVVASAPPKKPARRGSALPWFGGALAGGIVVAALGAGAWMTGLLTTDNGPANKVAKVNPQPPNPGNDPKLSAIAEKLREAKIDNPDVVEGVGQLVTDRQKAEEARDAAQKELTQLQHVGGGPADPITWLTGGDFDRALPALEKLGSDKVENQTAQGKALWWQYVRNQSKEGKPFRREDEQVKRALDLLQKASKQGNADALFWLGKIEEDTGNVAAAREIYQRGLNTDLKTLFQAQLDRMDQAEGTQSRAPEATPDDRALAAAVLLATLLQPPEAKQSPEAKQPPEPKPAPEAGQPQARPDEPEAAPNFFRAVRQARQGNYPEAITAIKEARKIYNETRYDRLLKAQNPKTDPDNKVFASTCDELQAYWEVLAALKTAGVDVAKQRNPAKAVGTLATQLEQSRKESAAMKALAAKFRDARYDDPDLVKDFDAMHAQLLDARKRAETEAMQLTEARRMLEVQAAQLTAIKSQLAAAGYRGNDLVKGVEQVAAERGKLAKERDDVVGSLNQVGQKVEVLMPATVDPKSHAAILAAVDRLIKEKFVTQLQEERNQVKKLNADLAERHSPQQMLDYWLPALQDRSQKALVAPAEQDVRRVLEDPASKPADRAKARYVEALALRDAGKAAEARTRLSEALKAPLTPQPAWWADAVKTRGELTQPTAYYVPAIRALAAQRKSAEALNLLTQALALFPNNRGQLLIVRGEIHLDDAETRAAGRAVTADNPLVAEVRRDAEEAATAGAAAESQFLLGRLAEAMNNLSEAQANYRKALELHPTNDAAGDRYRLGVARTLWKANQGKPAALPTAPSRVGLLGPSEALALLVVFLQPGDQLPGLNPELREAGELAKQVQNSRAAQQDFAMRAQSLAIQGLWNEALRVYLDGIRPRLRREDADTLSMLILNHPGFRTIPDVSVIPDPQTAEAHYASGLLSFYNGRLPTAEKDFLAAIKFDKLDARYYYFLGLTRWLLEADKGAAILAFQEGARLEKQARPGREAVNDSLERVQGGLRRVLDRYRP